MFLSDDDPILDDAVAQVLQAISGRGPTVLCFGARDLGAANALQHGYDDADFTSMQQEGAIAAFFSVIAISKLVVMKMPLDIEAFRRCSPTIFPQVTLCLAALRSRFVLSVRRKVVVERNPGHRVRNFFELYCLGIRDAIKNAGWTDAERLLLPATEQSLPQFLKLQVLERCGHYDSREGMPL